LGASHALLPFWSPDNRQIGFFAHGKLKKISLSGGPPTILCDAPQPIQGRGTWGRYGDILFGTKDGVHRVSAEGGRVDKVITGGAVDHLLIGGQLEFLPDGRHFLYWLATGYAAKPEDIGIFLATLDGHESKRLALADSGAIYAESSVGQSYLVFVREGTLLAQTFDTVELRLKGEPVRLANQIIGGSVTSSANGILVYRKISTDPIQQQLGWFDRTGKPLEKVGSWGFIFNFALSPDEKRVVMSRRNPPQVINEDIWLVDLARGTETRFTSDPAIDHDPIWSPDGSLIVWNSNREKLADLYQKSSSGAGQDKLLLTTDNWKFACDWSNDGRSIIYGENDPKTSYDLWVLPLDGKSEPYPFLKTPFQDHQGHFSPDSKWVSYVSDKSGRMELYVQAFEPDSAIHQVSTSGVIYANASRWRRDGKEMFYVDSDGKMMAVEVKTGATFVAGEPKALFDINRIQAMPKTFDVTRDGQRFLFATLKEVAKPPPFTVVLNWSVLLPKPQ
jgi:eukaryotic-like serine/threonine-protein kinase